jgi:chromosome segregation ATPase
LNDSSNSDVQRSLGRIEGRLEAHTEAFEDHKKMFMLITEQMKSMNETLAKNTKELEIHIEGVRTARAELKVVEENLALAKSSFEKRVEPIEQHVQFVGKAVRFVVAGCSPAALYYMVRLVKEVLLPFIGHG